MRGKVSNYITFQEISHEKTKKNITTHPADCSHDPNRLWRKEGGTGTEYRRDNDRCGDSNRSGKRRYFGSGTYGNI